MRRRLALIGAAVVCAIAGVALLVNAEGDDGDPAPDPAAFCRSLERLADNDPFEAFGDRATEAEISAAFDALVQRADELLELAPDEPRGAARDLAETSRRLRDLLAEAGGNAAEVDGLAYSDAQARYDEAASRLERYLTAEC
ncbi:MAG: hypothetical protein M3Z03_12625 [Actinomycetota bacterium]|nr:hypothetical protein [Actinomycetota bacterium]